MTGLRVAEKVFALDRGRAGMNWGRLRLRALTSGACGRRKKWGQKPRREEGRPDGADDTSARAREKEREGENERAPISSEFVTLSKQDRMENSHLRKEPRDEKFSVKITRFAGSDVIAANALDSRGRFYLEQPRLGCQGTLSLEFAPG